MPSVVRRINNALRRADQIHHAEGDDGIDWFVPIVAERSPAAWHTPRMPT